MLYTVEVENKNGEIIRMPAIRVWLIAVIDEATRTILGYSLSPNENYNQTDVLAAIKNTIEPKIPISFTLNGLSYPSNGGFPSLAIEETKWAMFDNIKMDNAKSHLSKDVVYKLTEKLMCGVNFGSVATPETRAIEERMFKTLEENGYHRLPSRTGSNIHDNKRKNAEKDAIKYKITFNDIVELTEYLIAIYNNSPHSALNNLTPLQCMEQKIKNAGVCPYITNAEQKKIVNELTNIIDERTIRGGEKEGKRPYINYKGVEYRNDTIALSMALVGQKIILDINPNDISKIMAYLPDGSELGLLNAVGEWGRKPHSLKTRKEALKLANKNGQSNNPFYAPISELEDKLRERAKKERRARTKSENIRREQNKEPLSKESEGKKLKIQENNIQLEKNKETYSSDIQKLLETISIEEAFEKGLL